MNKANIRAVTAGAKRRLRDFQRALAEIKRIKVRETQKAARIVHKQMAARYAQGQYANEQGNVRNIRPYGAKWAKRKERLKLDMRNGVARKGILKQIGSPLCVVDHADGVEIDIKRPNLTVTGNATVGRSQRNIAGKAIVAGKGRGKHIVGYAVKRKNTKKRSFAVNRYIDPFADAKAPGLGSISRADEEFLEERASAKIGAHLASIEGARKRVLRGNAAVEVKLELRRLLK